MTGCQQRKHLSCAIGASALRSMAASIVVGVVVVTVSAPSAICSVPKCLPEVPVTRYNRVVVGLLLYVPASTSEVSQERVALPEVALSAFWAA